MVIPGGIRSSAGGPNGRAVGRLDAGKKYDAITEFSRNSVFSIHLMSPTSDR